MRRAVGVFAVALAACGGEARPIDREVPYNTFVVLSDSEDLPAPLEGEWRLVERPGGSDSEILDGERFFADLPGVYIASLVNGVETSAAELVRLRVTAVNLPPSIEVIQRGGASAFEPLTLDARGTADPNGDQFTLSWALSTEPVVGSADLQASADTAVLTPSEEGHHAVELIARDALGAESVEVVSIEVAVGYRVIDTGWGENAAYSEPHEAVLVFGYDAIAVYQIDTETMEIVAASGTFAQLAPDGLHFAMPQPGGVSIDIYTVVPLERVATLDFVGSLRSWVLGDEHVYYSTSANTVRRVHIESATDELVANGDGDLYRSIDPDHLYRRAFSGTYYRYDIAAEPPALEGQVDPETTNLYPAFQFEDRPWFVVGQDVARFSPVLAADLAVVDQMPDFVEAGDHSAERGQIVALLGTDPPALELVDDETLEVRGEVTPPEFGNSRPLPDRVFFDNAGQRLVLIATEAGSNDPGIAVMRAP